jgi:AraC-like DNA-binding protein
MEFCRYSRLVVLEARFSPSSDASKYPRVFGAPVLFGQSANRMLFDSDWLDGTPRLGNEITYSTVVSLCDAQIGEFQFHRGLVGEVRQILMKNLMRPKRFQEVAQDLNMSVRTLRRKLGEENSSFRQMLDELRRDIAKQEAAVVWFAQQDLNLQADRCGWSVLTIKAAYGGRYSANRSWQGFAGSLDWSLGLSVVHTGGTRNMSRSLGSPVLLEF